MGFDSALPLWTACFPASQTADPYSEASSEEIEFDMFNNRGAEGSPAFFFTARAHQELVSP